MASSSHLKPGQKGGITAQIDTQNRAGFLVKTVEVFTSDPDRPRVILILKAEVKGKERPAASQQTPVTR